MGISFTVPELQVRDMFRKDRSGKLVLGPADMGRYGDPKPTFQTVMVTGMTDVYDHEDTYDKNEDDEPKMKQVMDLEFEILTPTRDKGLRFSQRWVTATIGERAIFGRIWRAAGLSVPQAGADMDLTDLIGKPLQAKLTNKLSGGGRTYTKLVNGTMEPVEPDDAAEAAPAPVAATRRAQRPPAITADEDPFDQADEPGF